MLGAIIGDIIGSPYEYMGFKGQDFPLFSEKSTFTDDTVLTVAVADALLHKLDFAQTLKTYGRRYPAAGYGSSFLTWMQSDTQEPYHSWGNGSAMRTSPIGFFYEDQSVVLTAARQCASVTHNHREGIKGAQAVSYGIYLARHGSSKADIRYEINHWFGYNLNHTLDEIRPIYHFDVSCQGTVPPAFLAFLDSGDYISAVRNAISLGGDADTLACITGSIAEAFYGKIPADVVQEARSRLPQEFLDIIDEFYRTIGKKNSRR
jgi:ADP-ribosylglycohydrolase